METLKSRRKRGSDGLEEAAQPAEEGRGLGVVVGLFVDRERRHGEMDGGWVVVDGGMDSVGRE